MSIAVTHVLTLGITAILISGLLLGASTLLETEREGGAEQSLETVGERLSGEIASVDRMTTNQSGNVTLRVDHPRRVSGSTYSIELSDSCSSPLLERSDHCLILSARNEDVEVQVPTTITSAAVDAGATAYGGPITIVSDGTTISIESGHS